MDRLRTARELGSRTGAEAQSTRALLTILTAAIATPVLLSAWLLPPALVLPMLSLAALAGAGAMAVTAWYTKAQRDPSGITTWDVAGAFVLLGCAAAMLSEPANVTQLFEHVMTAG